MPKWVLRLLLEEDGHHSFLKTGQGNVVAVAVAAIVVVEVAAQEEALDHQPKDDHCPLGLSQKEELVPILDFLMSSGTVGLVER